MGWLIVAWDTYLKYMCVYIYIYIKIMRVWGNKLRSKSEYPTFCHLFASMWFPAFSWDGQHLCLALVHRVPYDFYQQVSRNNSGLKQLAERSFPTCPSSLQGLVKFASGELLPSLVLSHVQSKVIMTDIPRGSEVQRCRGRAVLGYDASSKASCSREYFSITVKVPLFS